MLKWLLCRVAAQPFEFTAGSPVSGAAIKKISDSANGLFAGSGGPKPPPALSTAVLGMRSGGKVGFSGLPSCSAHQLLPRLWSTVHALSKGSAAPLLACLCRA